MTSSDFPAKAGRAVLMAVLAAAMTNPAVARAQDPAEEPSGFATDESEAEGTFYTIDSEPVRSHMSLLGSTRLEGDSPLTIPGDVYGSFQIDARASGYERQRGVVRFPGAGAPLEVGTMLRGGAGTALASVALPGLGEILRGGGDEVRGVSFLAAGGSGLGAVVAAELRRRDGEEEAKRARAAALMAPTTEERTAFQLEAARQAARADRARIARRDWVIVCAGVWSLSLVDTYIWTPRLRPAEVELTDLTLGMRPLSRTQAALRSIVPGLGQHYSGRPVAGTLAFFGGLAAGMAFVAAEHDFDEAVHRLASVQALYDDPLADPEALALIRPELEKEAQEADDARTRRNLLAAVAGGVWAANMIDAMLATPTPENGEGGDDEALAPSIESGAAKGLALGPVLALGFSPIAGGGGALAPGLRMRLSF